MTPPTTCGCNQCGTCYWRTYARRRHRLKAYGQWQPWADAAPVLEHMNLLRANNIGVDAIAQRAGVSRSTVIRIRRLGPGRRVASETAQRILSVNPHTQAYRTNPTGAKRRLQALMAIGHSSYKIAAHLKIGQTFVWRITSRDIKWVTPSTDKKIRDVYDQLSMTPGTSKRAVKAAQHHGWLPPLAWDNIDDDLDETPRTTTSAPSKRRTDDSIDEVVIDKLLRGENIPATKAEQEETVLRIMANPEKTLADFAQLSHLPVRSIAERIHTRNRRAA